MENKLFESLLQDSNNQAQQLFESIKYNKNFDDITDLKNLKKYFEFLAENKATIKNFTNTVELDYEEYVEALDEDTLKWIDKNFDNLDSIGQHIWDDCIHRVDPKLFEDKKSIKIIYEYLNNLFFNELDCSSAEHQFENLDLHYFQMGVADIIARKYSQKFFKENYFEELAY